MSYVYLATAYSHSDPEVRHMRFEQAKTAAVWLLKKGIWVYSPIVHCHPLAVDNDLPTDYKFWKSYNSAMLEQAKALWVLVTGATLSSKGVRAEVDEAIKLGMDMALLYPSNEGYTVIGSLVDVLSKISYVDFGKNDAQNP